MDEGGGKRDENTPALMNPMTFFVADMKECSALSVEAGSFDFCPRMKN
jgi:hypothetical protein